MVVDAELRVGEDAGDAGFGQAGAKGADEHLHVAAAADHEAGDEDVVRKLVGDLIAAGIETDEAAIRTALDEKMVEARRQLMTEI